MAAGFPRARADIDQRSGTLVVSLRNLFDEIGRFQTFLLATPDADLEAAPISYSPGDVAVLKSAFTQLAQLARIYRGEEALAAAQDFRVFADRLAGVL